MYTALEPSPYSTHKLTEYISHRVESRLENFHEPLANYANTAMSHTLADILNHAGTAKFNTTIRHKLLTRTFSDDKRKSLPAHYLKVPQFYNHSELSVVNANAEKCGAKDPPFANVRPLPEDNGERFFSEYNTEQKDRNQNVTPSNYNARCQCRSCAKNPVELIHSVLQEEQEAAEPPKKKTSERVNSYTLSKILYITTECK